MRHLKALILISIGILLSNLKAEAQYVPGASGYHEISLMLSRTFEGGTARMQGIGGAQTALGGDISSALSNPAGLGLFNRSEFSISPSFNFISTDTEYLGVNSSEFDTRLNFANIGVVLNNTKDNVVPGKWRGGSFGISITKVNDFNSKIFYEGDMEADFVDEQSTILDYFAQDAYGLTPDQLPILHGLAYDTYLINTDDLFFDEGFNDVYYPITFASLEDDDAVDFDYTLNKFPYQLEAITTRGGQYQWSFSYGGNYADKFYFGLGLGIQSVRYEMEKEYTENIDDDPALDLVPGVDFTIDENVRIDGTGFNGTLGFIARPYDFIRFGASVTSPTFFNIDDEYTASLYTDYFQPGHDDYYFPEGDTLLNQEEAHSDLIISEYKVRTPLKANGGVAFFFGKNGFITGDVEYVDYSNTEISSNDFNDAEDNRLINDSYQSVINFKVGGEYRFDVFRFRAGYAHFGDPYQASSIDKTQDRISFGAGIRLPKFYIDLAVVNSTFNSTYSPYDLNPEYFPFVSEPVVDISNSVTNTVLSAGFFF